MKVGFRNVSGQVKNKAETMRRLVMAVGTIIKTKGYKGLGLNSIAREADVSKILIYRYFGGVDQLIEAYVLEKDYWISQIRQVDGATQHKMDSESLKTLVCELLRGQFKFFYENQEMQALILWEITERSTLLNSIGNVRESNGNVIIEMTEPFFKGSNKNFKATTAILVSAIYYMILHAKKNESTICGIDINSEAGQNAILKTIDQIIDWTFAPIISKA